MTAEKFPKFDELLDAERSIPEGADEACQKLADLCQQIMEQSPLFAGVADEKPAGSYILRQLALATRPHRIEDDKPNIEEKDSGYPVMLVVNGMVRVFRETKTDRYDVASAFLAFRGPGDHVAAQNAILEKQHFFTTRTCGITDLLYIDAKAFRAAHAASPQLARNVLEAFTERYYREVESRQVFFQVEVPGKVELILLEVATALGFDFMETGVEPGKLLELTGLT